MTRSTDWSKKNKLIKMNSFSFLFTKINYGARIICASIEHSFPHVKQNKIIIALLDLFQQEGIIRNYSFQKISIKKNKLIIYLKYDEQGQSVFSSINQISTPGCRKYLTTQAL